jgi:hypothetical protein
MGNLVKENWKMTIFEYPADGNKNGVNATYCTKNNVLFVKIKGSNSFRDYLDNFLAWPRLAPPEDGFRFHPKWFHEAWSLSEDIIKNVTWDDRQTMVVAGHSAGGAIATMLPYFLKCSYATIYPVNAPKSANKKYYQWLKEEGHSVIVRYDKGDIVRFFPLLYAKYPDHRRGWCYASTRPFWKAHNNLPFWFHSYPDKVNW